MGPAKVYNIGIKPIVWRRTFKGTEVIHPGKSDIFSHQKAKEIIKKFPDAVSEEDYKKIQDEKKKEAVKKVIDK